MAAIEVNVSPLPAQAIVRRCCARWQSPPNLQTLRLSLINRPTVLEHLGTTTELLTCGFLSGAFSGYLSRRRQG